MYLNTGVPVYQCTCAPVYLCTSVLVYRCTSVPVYQCIGVPVYHESKPKEVHAQNVCRYLLGGGGGIQRTIVFLILDITKLVQACSSLFKAAQGLFKAVQGVFIPVLPVHRCTGVPLWRCTGVTVIPVRIGVPVYHELLPLTIAINKPPMTKARRWNHEKLAARRLADFCEPLIIAK